MVPLFFVLFVGSFAEIVAVDEARVDVFGSGAGDAFGGGNVGKDAVRFEDVGFELAGFLHQQLAVFLGHINRP